MTDPGVCDNCAGPRKSRRVGPYGGFCSKPECQRVFNAVRMRAYMQRKKDELGHSYFRQYRPAAEARRRARIQAGEELPERQRWPERYREVDDQRRAKKRAAEAEQFTRREIYERDRWVCQICYWPVSPEARYPDPGSASLDHVLPLALGGAHTRANSRLAHLLCNTRRGTDLRWTPTWHRFRVASL